MYLPSVRKIYLGSTDISRAYLGDTLVWPATGKYAKEISSLSELNETDTYILVGDQNFGPVNEPYRYIASNKYFYSGIVGTEWYPISASTYGDAIYVPDDAIRVKFIERLRGDDWLNVYIKVDWDIIARDPSTWATTIVSNPYLCAKNSGTVSNIDTDIYYRDTLENSLSDTFQFYTIGNEVFLRVVGGTPTILNSLPLHVDVDSFRLTFNSSSWSVTVKPYKIIKTD